MEIEFICARPCEAHARQVMAWRNDPITLEASFGSVPKKWPEFFEEFKETYFTLPALPPLFAVLEGKLCGFLRFRPAPIPEHPGAAIVDISINVAPSYRGKGIGKAMLQAATPLLKTRGVDAVYAEIKAGNSASKRIFETAGYLALDSAKKQETTIWRYLLPIRTTVKKPVFIIAEAGSNWRMGTPARDKEMAKTLIAVAAEAGADAVKFQVFRPEEVYVANAGKSDYLAEAGIEQEITEIFQDLAMPYEMLPMLAEECRKVGIEFMATPFSPQDFAAIDPLVSRHKIASYEISHLRLLELCGRSGKPTYLSTGAAVEQEIAWAVDTFYKEGGTNLTLLQCTAAYPAPPDSCNLRVISWLKERFGVASGLSDHSCDPVYAPLAAVALGATVIEKHYTLDKRLPGPDHSFAATASELKEMVKGVRACEQMLGSGHKVVGAAEEELRSYARRGVQAIRDIAPGELLREGVNIAILRPGKQPLGCHPRHLGELEGSPASQAIPQGHGVLKL